MTAGIIIFVVVAITGIIFLSKGSPMASKKTRETYLREIVEIYHGKQSTLEDKEDSYQVNFRFEEHDFVYEDVEDEGFSGTIYKGILRLPMKSSFTIKFSDKARGGHKIRTDIFIASDVESGDYDKESLVAPKGLSDVKIDTSDISLANWLLKDANCSDLFMIYKNIDNRGCPLISMRIVNGVIMLDFHSQSDFKPNLAQLMNNPGSLEDYCDQLINISTRINTFMNNIK